MGDVEQLPDGDTFIGWGGLRTIASELTPDGQLARDLEIGAPGLLVYRWYEGSWQGNPDTAPTLVANTDGDAITLYYSWNGATEVGAYRVEAGQTQDSFKPVITQARQGFETSTVLGADQPQACFYRVMAQDKQGRDMAYSNTIKLDTPGCT